MTEHSLESLNDRAIIRTLREKHIDTEHYGIGLAKFREIRESMGLQHTCQQGHTVESIRDAMMDIRQMYPKAGIREVISLLFHEKNMSVSRTIVSSYFAIFEPELVHECKARCLKRRRFWAAGVNDLFAVNQHVKWLRFGLGLHTGIKPFSGHIMWIHVWHSNRNLQLIYHTTLIPSKNSVSDLGTKNFGIANAQTLLRQHYDPDLRGMLQHRWMRFKKIMVFCWVFIPWLQHKLDVYRDCVNNTAKRHDRNKILPHGVPSLIYDSPQDFNALDFKVT
ncbi:hypothetical protein EV702DRAFT_1179146 [Suillus placidus]|uniref:Uncharacterized protein n=1 Tax=Suillus placidus TaxID=48579 RepID=A0A9P6ZW60_9AGAM|nr:hypothetical protein EV702DRAFT_1179146 [Suillus placidus]